MTLTTEQHQSVPLVLTATVNPNGMSGLSVSDCREREQQYITTLQFYMRNGSVSNVVFVENSGWDLARIRSVVPCSYGKNVEWLSCSLNDFPRELGKSYGEMRLLDFAVDHSKTILEKGYFAKATGRFPILNIDMMLREAETRKPWAFFCDTKDHCLYDRLRLGWCGHSVDTRFYIVTNDFYRDHFYGKYRQLNDALDSSVEKLFYETVMANPSSEPIILRFRTEPEYSGKAGHVRKSIIDSNNYSGRWARTKRLIRQVGRIIAPDFWF